MTPSVSTNKCKGNPGTDTFIYKLPKGITIPSISFAINLICRSGLPGSDNDIDNEIVENNLVRIYPNLNRSICHHFILLHNEGVHDANNDTNGNSDCTKNFVRRSCLICKKELINCNTKDILCDNCTDLPNKVNSLEASVLDIVTRLNDQYCDHISIDESLIGSTVESPNKGNNRPVSPEVSETIQTVADLECHEQNVINPSLQEQFDEYKTKQKQLHALTKSNQTNVIENAPINTDIQTTRDSMTREERNIT